LLRWGNTEQGLGLRAQGSGSVTEKENQIDARPLDSPFVDAVGGAGRFRSGVQVGAEEPRNLILQLELCRRAVSELLIQLEERALVQLLTECDRSAEIAGLGRGGDLEQVQVKRLAD
jgi:hypothetical protein